MDDLFTEMQRRYRERDLPWDHELPPPEVLDLASWLPPGRMLDLGCGAGRACIYLARHGWTCDGVDWVPEAIAMARQRAEAAGVAENARFHVAPVTRLDMLDEPYDLALDVGCLHAQSDEDRRLYAGEVDRLVRPGGWYVLFAHLRDTPSETGPRGMPEHAIRELFADSFSFERVEHGTTTVRDEMVSSAWFWLRRRGPKDAPPNAG